MAYTVMAYVVVATLTHGLYSCGINSHDLYIYGLCSYGVCRCGLCRRGHVDPRADELCRGEPQARVDEPLRAQYFFIVVAHSSERAVYNGKPLRAHSSHGILVIMLLFTLTRRSRDMGATKRSAGTE